MSSTLLLPPREQLYNRYCSNKHTRYPPPPHANSFIIGTAVINTHTVKNLTPAKSKGPRSQCVEEEEIGESVVYWYSIQ
jgi:hypothetical protein